MRFELTGSVPLSRHVIYDGQRFGITYYINKNLIIEKKPFTCHMGRRWGAL